MNDAQILDWLEKNYTKFCEEGLNNDENRFTLEYIGINGGWRKVRGASLRACVLKLLGKAQ